MSRDGIVVEVDGTAQAAYIRLSNEPVARSVNIDDELVVDLDEFNVAIGIEVLALGVEIPFSRLTTEFHVHTDVVETLRLIQPSVAGFLTSHGTDGTAAPSPIKQPAALAA